MKIRNVLMALIAILFVSTTIAQDNEAEEPEVLECPTTMAELEEFEGSFILDLETGRLLINNGEEWIECTALDVSA